MHKCWLWSVPCNSGIHPVFCVILTKQASQLVSGFPSTKWTLGIIKWEHSAHQQRNILVTKRLQILAQDCSQKHRFKRTRASDGNQRRSSQALLAHHAKGRKVMVSAPNRTEFTRKSALLLAYRPALGSHHCRFRLSICTSPSEQRRHLA